MITEFRVPQLNPNDIEILVVRWKVNNGATVSSGQEIVEVETAKAVVELEAPVSGHIKQACLAGDILKVGKILAWIADSQESLTALEDKPTEINGGNVLSENPESSPASNENRRHSPLPPSRKKSQESRFSRSAQARIQALGIPESRFEGMGLVTNRVVDSVLEATSGEATTKGGSEFQRNPLRTQRVPPGKALEIDLLTHGQANLINSSLTVLLPSEGIRQTLRDWQFEGSLLSLILYELTRLLREHPRFNAFYHNGFIHFYDTIDVNLALDLEKGLKAPIIRDAGKMTLQKINEAVHALVRGYLENSLRPEELIGGTVTVTDLSGENILHFQPLRNKNQAIIIGIGGDADPPGHPLSITCVFDHRVLSGQEVGQFLNSLKERLSSYTLEGMPVTGQAFLHQRTCSRCGIDLKSLEAQWGDQAMLVRMISTRGEGWICHRCLPLKSEP
ncbi:MAG: 2-oxo acid dehydrogenase subunit E2 [Magnetococcales bacterium]|nr:2-oxo acid dehydrogenase subunit E2 [Magnetococcales bacterium]